MKGNFNINLNALKTIKRAYALAFAKTVHQLVTDIENEQVLPFREGTLSDSRHVDINNLEADISWNTPYSRRLYYHPEFNFSKEHHINAQGLWCDYWLYGPGKYDVVLNFSKFFKQDSGGVLK